MINLHDIKKISSSYWIGAKFLLFYLLEQINKIGFIKANGSSTVQQPQIYKSGKILSKLSLAVG